MRYFIDVDVDGHKPKMMAMIADDGRTLETNQIAEIKTFCDPSYGKPEFWVVDVESWAVIHDAVGSKSAHHLLKVAESLGGPTLPRMPERRGTIAAARWIQESVQFLSQHGTLPGAHESPARQEEPIPAKKSTK